jgi:hypothetical protein
MSSSKKVTTHVVDFDKPDARYSNRRDTAHAMDRAVVCSDSRIVNLAYRLIDREYNSRFSYVEQDLRSEQRRAKKRKSVSLPKLHFMEGQEA